MNAHQREIQAAADAAVAAFAQPDGTVEVINRKDWARCHPIICPWCKQVFYGWKPLDADWPGFLEDPEPKKGDRVMQRRTCGHPLCHKSEQNHQFNRMMGKE